MTMNIKEWIDSILKREKFYYNCLIKTFEKKKKKQS